MVLLRSVCYQESVLWSNLVKILVITDSYRIFRSIYIEINNDLYFNKKIKKIQKDK